MLLPDYVCFLFCGDVRQDSRQLLALFSQNSGDLRFRTVRAIVAAVFEVTAAGNSGQNIALTSSTPRNLVSTRVPAADGCHRRLAAVQPFRFRSGIRQTALLRRYGCLLDAGLDASP